MPFSAPNLSPQSGLRSLASIPIKILKKFGFGLIILLLVMTLATSGFLYWKYRTTIQQLQATLNNDPTQEVATLTAEISQFMYLPNEQPTVATVTDKAALKTQEFFTLAENGDKVLIFVEAKKAILYRPSERKILNVAPLATESDAQNVAANEAAALETGPKIPITLLNGSTQVGVTNLLDDRLITKFPNLQVTGKSAASKNDYAQTVVIDVSGNNSQLVAQIAQEISGVVGPLPEGESSLNGEIVVIVGNN